MKKVYVIGIIIMCVLAMCGMSGCDKVQIDTQQTNDEIAKLQADIDELTDANERLADMYTDIEAENKELRETNKALAADNEALANQDPIIEYVEVPTVEYVETETDPAQDEFIECGACGAHVHDWYYVQSMDGQNLVEVCGYCYDTYLDSMEIN